MHDFVPGLELSRKFYVDVVAGLLRDKGTRLRGSVKARWDTLHPSMMLE
jgi:hypothetical protein